MRINSPMSELVHTSPMNELVRTYKLFLANYTWFLKFLSLYVLFFHWNNHLPTKLNIFQHHETLWWVFPGYLYIIGTIFMSFLCIPFLTSPIIHPQDWTKQTSSRFTAIYMDPIRCHIWIPFTVIYMDPMYKRDFSFAVKRDSCHA